MERLRRRDGVLFRWVRAGAMAAVCTCAFAGTVRADEVSDVVRDGIAMAPNTEARVVGNVTVFKTPGPDRRLDFVTIVPVRAAAVWRALTTVEGIQSFYTPGAIVDLRPGGAYEMHLKPDAPPGQRGMEGTKVLSFVPESMLAGTGSAPPEFPEVRAEGTKWVILLDEVKGGTRVQLSMPEWGVGSEWDRAFDYFAEHNPAFLEALRRRFTEGPVDWKARGVEAPPAKPMPAPPKLWRVDKSLAVKVDPSFVWRLLTTEEGLEQLKMAVEARVELKFGGRYERLTNPTAPEGRRGQEGARLLAYVPGQMISYTWLAPPRFPEVRKGPAWETWRFHDLGDGWVRLRYTALGMGEGPQWRDAFNLLDQRMELVMGNLRMFLSPE